jgi:hypothetical protein
MAPMPTPLPSSSACGGQRGRLNGNQVAVEGSFNWPLTPVSQNWGPRRSIAANGHCIDTPNCCQAARAPRNLLTPSAIPGSDFETLGTRRHRRVSTPQPRSAHRGVANPKMTRRWHLFCAQVDGLRAVYPLLHYAFCAQPLKRQVESFAYNREARALRVQASRRPARQGRVSRGVGWNVPNLNPSSNGPAAAAHGRGGGSTP